MTQQSFPNNFSGTQQPLYTPTSDEKTIGTLAHALTFVSQFIAPLVIYLVKKDESNFIAEHAKEALNFQLTVGLIYIVLFISVIGIFLIGLVYLAATILVVVASYRAYQGKSFSYPFCIRFIR